MKNIHVMIAEDEELAREELIYLLKKEQDVITCPSAENGKQLIDLYTEHKPDVIFLDVQMPGMQGVAAAKRVIELATIHPPLFVFTTAYDEYAVDAFEIDAIDYLLKPYDESRFLKTLQRVRKQLEHIDKKENKHVQPQIQTTTTKLLVDDGDRMVVLSPNSIYYAVPSKRILEIHTKDEVIESRLTLQELEEKLQDHSFFRTHRSYLVNLNYIREITPWFNGTCNVTLEDKHHTTLPVSRSARKILLELFKN